MNPKSHFLSYDQLILLQKRLFKEFQDLLLLLILHLKQNKHICYFLIINSTFQMNLDIKVIYFQIEKTKLVTRYYKINTKEHRRILSIQLTSKLVLQSHVQLFLTYFMLFKEVILLLELKFIHFIQNKQNHLFLLEKLLHYYC